LPAEIYGNDEPFLETLPASDPDLKTEVQEMLISMLLKHGAER
jgi:hypothetical protein